MMSSQSLDLATLRHSKRMPTLYFRGQAKVFDFHPPPPPPLHPTGMTLWQELAENTADSVYIQWKAWNKTGQCMVPERKRRPGQSSGTQGVDYEKWSTNARYAYWN